MNIWPAIQLLRPLAIAAYRYISDTVEGARCEFNCNSIERSLTLSVNNYSLASRRGREPWNCSGRVPRSTSLIMMDTVVQVGINYIKQHMRGMSTVLPRQLVVYRCDPAPISCPATPGRRSCLPPGRPVISESGPP